MKLLCPSWKYLLAGSSSGLCAAQACHSLHIIIFIEDIFIIIIIIHESSTQFMNQPEISQEDDKTIKLFAFAEGGSWLAHAPMQ